MGYNINGLDDLSENLKKLAEKGVSELNKGLDKIKKRKAKGAGSMSVLRC